VNALAITTCEMQWIKYVLDDLNIWSIALAVLYSDIKIDCYVLWEKIRVERLHLLPIKFADQLVDVSHKSPKWIELQSNHKQVWDGKYTASNLRGGY